MDSYLDLFNMRVSNMPLSSLCNNNAYCLKLNTNFPNPMNFQKIEIVVTLFTIYADLSKIIVFNHFSTFLFNYRQIDVITLLLLIICDYF